MTWAAWPPPMTPAGWRRCGRWGRLQIRRGGGTGAGSRWRPKPPSSAGQLAAGAPEGKVGAGIGAQVALARRDSPARGAGISALPQALVELPHTLAAFTAGQISEWRATLIARETACLTREDRAQVDAELAGPTGGLGALGDREPPPRPAGSPTGSTRTRHRTGPPGRTASGGSPCARRRTR